MANYCSQHLDTMICLCGLFELNGSKVFRVLVSFISSLITMLLLLAVNQKGTRIDATNKHQNIYICFFGGEVTGLATLWKETESRPCWLLIGIVSNPTSTSSFVMLIVLLRRRRVESKISLVVFSFPASWMEMQLFASLLDIMECSAGDGLRCKCLCSSMNCYELWVLWVELESEKHGIVLASLAM